MQNAIDLAKIMRFADQALLLIEGDMRIQGPESAAKMAGPFA
jgi:hypothetical protein